ncbi:hypothetical protein VSU19_16940 [Verrucomicrobiales bacterium BCK34]|nr:hypothetical protein [Verrucomicrobiales bacterium BCK34]
MRHVRTLQIYNRQVRIGPEQLSEASGVHEDLILEFERIGILPSEADSLDGQPVFTAESIHRCREIDHLHRSQHLSFHFIRRWIELNERLARAEKALEANGIEWDS